MIEVKPKGTNTKNAINARCTCRCDLLSNDDNYVDTLGHDAGGCACGCPPSVSSEIAHFYYDLWP